MESEKKARKWIVPPEPPKGTTPVEALTLFSTVRLILDFRIQNYNKINLCLVTKFVVTYCSTIGN